MGTWGEVMARRTLVVFENERVCPGAVAYAREYCLRMDLEVGLLMLADFPTFDRRSLDAKRRAVQALERRVSRLLSTLSRDFLRRGTPVSEALRIGDPARELLSFLAERAPFRTVIWGSDERLPAVGPNGRVHWLAGVAERLDCPLFTVSQRSPAAPTRHEAEE